MKIIHNNFLPPRGYKAINIFGVLFVRKGSRELLEHELNHETIHTDQMQELLYIFFYLWYLFEWIIRIFQYGLFSAYENISFEREAYKNHYNLNYLKERKRFNFTKYMKKDNSL